MICGVAGAMIEEPKAVMAAIPATIDTILHFLRGGQFREFSGSLGSQSMKGGSRSEAGSDCTCASFSCSILLFSGSCISIMIAKI